MTLSQAPAKRIDMLLKEKGMSQYRLFKKSGVPQSTISSIRHMKNNSVSTLLLYRIAQGFDMSLREFFDSPLFSQENIQD